MTQYLTRADLEKLQYLLRNKLLHLGSVAPKDSDAELSEAILKFVEFLVQRQLSQFLSSVHSVHPPVHHTSWATNTTAPSVLFLGKPDTICDNCWQKCSGKHTHCTHMILNDMDSTTE